LQYDCHQLNQVTVESRDENEINPCRFNYCSNHVDCMWKERRSKNVEQQEQVASEVSAPTTPEQQAAINAIDKPELQDKKNAEAVSPASEEAASEAH
jgi:hypothetical protein